MSHQDKRTDGTRYNSVYLMEARQWMLARVRWNVQFRKDCRWTPRWLVSAAVLWAWSEETNLTDRFRCVQSLVIHLQADDSMRITSYQAFFKAVQTMDNASRRSIAIRIANFVYQVTAGGNPKTYHWIPGKGIADTGGCS